MVLPLDDDPCFIVLCTLINSVLTFFVNVNHAFYSSRNLIPLALVNKQKAKSGKEEKFDKCALKTVAEQELGPK